MISYVNDNHGSIWHRLSHFHSYKILFTLGVRIKYIYDSIASRMKRRRNQQSNDDDDENNSYVY